MKILEVELSTEEHGHLINMASKMGTSSEEAIRHAVQILCQMDNAGKIKYKIQQLVN